MGWESRWLELTRGKWKNGKSLNSSEAGGGNVLGSGLLLFCWGGGQTKDPVLGLNREKSQRNPEKQGTSSFTSAREPAQNISYSMFSPQNNIAKAKSPVSCYKALPLRVCECHSKLGPERNLLLDLLLVFNVDFFLWLLINIHQVFSWVRPCGR